MSNPGHHFGVHILLTKKQKRRTVDLMAYVIGVGGNLAVIPQIIKAWSSSAPGLAIATWMMFSGFGIIWLIYAVMHKQKPLIAAQITGLSCNLLVVAGWVFNTYIK